MCNSCSIAFVMRPQVHRVDGNGSFHAVEAEVQVAAVDAHEYQQDAQRCSESGDGGMAGRAHGRSLATFRIDSAHGPECAGQLRWIAS